MRQEGLEGEIYYDPAGGPCGESPDPFYDSSESFELMRHLVETTSEELLEDIRLHLSDGSKKGRRG